MKRLLKFVVMATVFYVLGHAIVWAQTNGPSLSIPSIMTPAFTIPMPSAFNSLLAAMVFSFVCKALAKVLDGYETKYPWLSPFVFLLEHAALKQDVAAMSERGVNAPTDNGLPYTTPPNSNIMGAASTPKTP